MQYIPILWIRSINAEQGRQVDKVHQIGTGFRQQFPASRQISSDNSTTGGEGFQKNQRQPLIK